MTTCEFTTFHISNVKKPEVLKQMDGIPNSHPLLPNSSKTSGNYPEKLNKYKTQMLVTKIDC